MDLNRAKEREHSRRLSQSNHEPAEAPAAKPKRRKRKKRPRGDTPPVARPGGREVLYYSSSDDDNRQQGNDGRGRSEERTGKEEANGGFDAGLTSYKKLLSSLEAGSGTGSGGSRSATGFGGGREDEELAAAVVARRMQREGRDDGYGSGSESGDEEREEGEEDDESDGEDADDVEGDDVGEQGQGSDGEEQREEEVVDESEGSNNGGLAAPTSDLPKDDEDADPGSDSNTDANQTDTTRSRSVKTTDGRSRDEFCRHFVSTPVFAAEKAAELLSARGRPSFKPLSSTGARSKWGAVGLSAVVSRDGTGYDGVVPPALPKGASLSAELGVLPSLTEGWDACTDGTSASELQSLLLPPLTGYRDLLYCGWRDEDAVDIRRCYALHALNHALTSRRRVTRHNVRLRKAAEEARVAEALARAERKASSTAGGDVEENNKAAVSNGNGSGGGGRGGGRNQSRKKNAMIGTEMPAASAAASLAPTAASNHSASVGDGVPRAAAGEKKQTTVELDSEDWQRDQGFTRPKVLILLPFRGLAHELVEIMIGLLGPKTVAVNKDRFDEEYGPDHEAEVGGYSEGAEADGPKQGYARAERERAVLERKPRDWKALLGEGRNVDDMFTIGVSLSPGGGKGKPGEGKGVAMRLYCDFYNSDIIIASPVALHRASVPGEGAGDGDSGGSGGVDSDFLSSVEVCILDRADVFLMQNWAYVPDIAEVLNSRPTGERAARADFSRVRPLFLHEQGRLFRQTLVFSAFQVCVCVCELECVLSFWASECASCYLGAVSSAPCFVPAVPRRMRVIRGWARESFRRLWWSSLPLMQCTRVLLFLCHSCVDGQAQQKCRAHKERWSSCVWYQRLHRYR